MAQSPQSSIHSGSSRSKYDQMLGTVTHLQSDLQRTLGLCQALRDENDKLRSNFEVVKAELLKIREKYQQQRQQLLDAVESRMETDVQTEAMVQKWRAQLDSRTRELELLQAKFAPQDLDMLRSRVQEELQGPHNKKVAELKEEGEKFRQMLFTVRREYERCKAEYDQYMVDHNKMQESSTAQHKREVHALKLKIKELEASLLDLSKDDEILRLQRRVDELVSCEDILKHQLTTVRADKDAIQQEAQAQAMAFQSQMASHHTIAANLKVDKQALQRQVDDLLAERTKLKATAEALQGQSDSLEADLARARSDAAAKEKAAVEARVAAASAQERSEAAWATELAQARASSAALSKRVELAESRAREAASESQERLKEARQIKEEGSREVEEELVVMRGEVDRLRAELSVAVSNAEEAREEAGAQKSRLALDMDGALSECSRLRREKDAIHARMGACITTADKAKARADGLAKEVEIEKAARLRLESRVKEAEEAVTLGQEEMEDVLQRGALLEEELSATRLEAGQMREEHIHNLRELKLAAARERDACIARVKGEISNVRRKAKASIRKERAKAHAYKTQAVELHHKALAARQTYAMQVSAGAVPSASFSAHTATDSLKLSEALARARARGMGIGNSTALYGELGRGLGLGTRYEPAGPPPEGEHRDVEDEDEDKGGEVEADMKEDHEEETGVGV
ncbi:unnamed protein product [Chrysoparadoxa australica]